MHVFCCCFFCLNSHLFFYSISQNATKTLIWRKKNHKIQYLIYIELFCRNSLHLISKINIISLIINMYNLYCYRYQNFELHTDTLYNMFIAFFYSPLYTSRQTAWMWTFIYSIQIIAFYWHYFKISSYLVLIN